MERLGIQFTRLESLVDELDGTDFDGFEYLEEAYRLEVGDSIESAPGMEDEGTIANEIAPEDNAVAVTFSEECADDYPSVHFLAPGNPLLTRLIELILEEDDSSERLEKIAELDSTSNLPIVATWGRNGQRGAIDEKGKVNEVGSIDDLGEWLTAYVENRGPGNKARNGGLHEFTRTL